MKTNGSRMRVTRGCARSGSPAATRSWWACVALLMLAACGSAAAQEAVAIGAGSDHVCAVLGDGTVKCWGHQEQNQLAAGRYFYSTGTPVDVIGIADAVAMTGGYQFSCFLLETGRIKCSGYNRWGQLGNGEAGCTFTDGAADCSLVTGIDDAIDVAAGDSHACAAHADGSVSCWGINNHGQLGLGSPATGETDMPLAVPGITDAFAIAAGDHHSCALVGAGAVKCWGRNHFGQLGIGSASSTGTPAPTDVAGIADATVIAAGGNHTCVLRAGGTVSCWGHEDNGALGNPEDEVNDYFTTPVSASGIGDAVGLAAGSNHTCVVHAAGTVSCFGNNYYGQIGNGSNRNNRFTPAAVVGVSHATHVTAGSSFTCARVADDPVNVKCWGFGGNGQIGNGRVGGTNERPGADFVVGSPFDTIFGGRGGSFETPL